MVIPGGGRPFTHGFRTDHPGRCNKFFSGGPVFLSTERASVRRLSMRAVTHAQRGSVSVEYLVILTVFMLGVALALASLGPGLVSVFQLRVAWLALPFP